MLWRAGGAGRGRAAGRAGLVLRRKGGRARAGAARPLPRSLARSLARSLSPSLPPSAGGFSQLACSPPARESPRAGASDAGAASCHCSSG